MLIMIMAPNGSDPLNTDALPEKPNAGCYRPNLYRNPSRSASIQIRNS
jgi:hypothetical protein